MPEADVYRVRQGTTHPFRWVRKAWYGRTWQAEWEGARRCARAYTERGVRRKAARMMARPSEPYWRYKIRYATKAWVHDHITRRNATLRGWRPWHEEAPDA